ncbi:Calcium homeostasis endoplasmic reticulum protein, partial [Fasciola hepatica]
CSISILITFYQSKTFDPNYQWSSGYTEHAEHSGRWEQCGPGGMNFGPRYPGPGPCTGPGPGPGPAGGWGPGGGPDNGWYAQPPWSGGPPFQGSGPGMPPVYRGFGPPPMEVGPPYRGRGYGMLPSYGGPPGPGSRGPYPPHQGYGYSNENYEDYQRRQGSQFQTSASEAGGENAQQELTEADVEQSEKNLKAQYDVLMEKQKAEILDLLDKKRLDAVKSRGEELGMTLEQMNEVIQPLIEACTKENISKGKTWVVERVAASAELTELDALQRVVPLVFCLASELADDEKKAKLNRVLDIWESNTYLPPSVLEKMRPPAMETFLREWKEAQEQNNQTEVEEIKKNVQSQYASLEQQHKEFTEHVHRQLASSMQQDVSDSGSSDSHHPPYDGPPHSRIQGSNSGYGMWNVPPSARGMPPYDMSVAGAVGEGYGNGDPHRRMPPGGYFMPHAQPHHSGGGGYPPPHGGWPGDHGPLHSNWGQPMPPMGPPHFHSHQGYGPPGARRDRGEGSSGGTVYIEGEEDEEVHEDYERSYDRSYESQYDNYHHYDDRGRDSRADRSYHYRSERSSRFSSSSSRHDNSRDESDDSPRDRRRSSHYPSDNGKTDAAPPPQEPIVDPKDLEPKCPHWELPAGLMHSLIRLCDFDYTPLDGSKLRLLPPKAPTDRLLSAVDAFYMPPSHDRTRDGEGWERLGLYEFYTKKEKARDHLERTKKKKRDSKTEDDSTPGSDSSNRRRRRYSGSSGAVSPSGDEDSQHADDYEHTRPFSRDESHSNSRPPAYHLCHITAYPASAIGQGVRTGSDALAMAPPPVQCIQGQLTHNYPGYKAVPAPTASGGIAIPPPGQGPVTGPGGAPPTNVPPGFPGPRFFQFPPPSMSQPPPGMPGVPTQGLIQRPTKGSSYGSRRSRFDSRRSRSKSSSRSLSGSGSPPARFTSAPGPGGLGAGGSNPRSGLHAARAAAMAVAASINNARNPNQVASSAGGSWTPGSDGQNGSPYVSGMPYSVDGYNQPGSFDNSYPADTSAQDHQTTRFLALDKCLPKRDYLQFVDIDPGTAAYSSVIQTGDLNSSVSMKSGLANEEDQFIVSSVTRQSETPPDAYSTGDDADDGDAMREKSDDQSTGLYLDPEWLCILRSTNHLMSTSKVPCILPTPETKERCDFSATSEEIRVLCEPFDNEFAVPDNFERTAPTYKPNDVGTGTLAASTPQAAGKQKLLFSNPQTELICAMLDLVNPNAVLLGRESYSLVELSSQLESKRVDEVDEGNEDLDEEENEDTENEDVVDGGEVGPSELDGTEPFDAPLGNLVHEEPSQTDLSWMSSHAEYDPLDNIASSPSHPLLQPQSPPESAFVVKQQLSVSHNPEEVNLDELDDDDDDDGTTNHAGSSGTSPSAAYTTEAYSPQPLDSTYATGMAYPVYENPSDDGKENAPILLDAPTAHETSNQSSTSEVTGNSG